MKVEKLEHVAVDVKNLDEAAELLSDVLGIQFVNIEGIKVEKTITEHANRNFEESKLRIAMDRTGFLELMESTPPLEKEGLRNIHLKVPNIEQAKVEMQQKGIRLMVDIKIGGLKEAIFNPDDLHGIRLCLVEYEAPTMVDAMFQ